MRARQCIAVLGMALGMTGCGPGSTDQQGTVTTPPAITDEERQMGVTGIPIDPSQKTVVVVTPPGAARSPQQQMSELQAQNARTGARIESRMKTYARNLSDTGAKDRAANQMNDDLDAYKKQSLEMYKLQQQMPDTPPQGVE